MTLFLRFAACLVLAVDVLVARAGAQQQQGSSLPSISELAQGADSKRSSKKLPDTPESKPSQWKPGSRRLLAKLQLQFAGRRESVLIELFDRDAPNTVRRFRENCEQGVLEGTAIHRAIAGFLVQMGDPLTRDASTRTRWGTGGEDRLFGAEIGRKHGKGTLSMARRGNRVNPSRQSNGSQFFIALGKYAALDGEYTAFGQVVDGLEVIEKISKMPADGNDCPLARIEVGQCQVFEHEGPWNRESEDRREIFAGRPEASGFLGRLLQRIW